MNCIKKKLKPVMLSGSLSLSVSALMGALAIAPVTVHAQSGSEQAGSVEVALNKSKVLQFGTPIRKVSVGNPNIADIVVLQSRQIYVVGKKLGCSKIVRSPFTRA